MLEALILLAQSCVLGIDTQGGIWNYLWTEFLTATQTEGNRRFTSLHTHRSFRLGKFTINESRKQEYINDNIAELTEWS